MTSGIRFVGGRFIAGHFVTGRSTSGRFNTGRFPNARFLPGHLIAGSSVRARCVAGSFANRLAGISLALLAAIALSQGAADAAILTVPGFTCTVASQSGLPAAGTHFHSNHAGAFGNPPDKAEVGSLKDQALSMEECRGLSEFDLTGLVSGVATLRFVLLQPGGLFPPTNSFPFAGNIGVLSYTANNADDIGDYSITPASAVGTFPTAGLLAGSMITFDVTSLYNAQIAAGSPSFGVRLQTTPSTATGGGAFTFDTFSLTVVTPEPAGIAMMSISACAALRRRRRR